MKVILLAVGLLTATGSLTVSSFVHDQGNGGTRLSSAPVVLLPATDPPTVVGVSRLLRTDKGIGFDIETTGLMPGNPYSFWVFIDESPASLAGPPGVEPFEIRLTVNGGFASPSGTQRFSGFLPAGALPPVNGMSVTDVDDGFFDDPKGANISLAVRSHGPPIAGMEYDQTNFLFGGCPPNTCETIQGALHVGKRQGNGNGNGNDDDDGDDEDDDQD